MIDSWEWVYGLELTTTPTSVVASLKEKHFKQYGQFSLAENGTEIY